MFPLPAQLVVSLVVIAVMLNLILLSTAYLIFLERKVAAWAQDRIGPNRTNYSFGLNDIWKKIGLGKFFDPKNFMFGLGQALADGLKLFVKEDYTPAHVNKGLFLLAPMAAIVPAMLGWAVIPWGGVWDFPGLWIGDEMIVAPDRVSVTVAPIAIGVIFILAMGSLAVYGVTLGGYASNNKYAFFGSLRATAQMLSYEIPMGVIVLISIMIFATADAGLLVNHQAGAGWGGIWGVFMHPLLAAIFFVCILAECNRAPFDLAEAEQELVGGFHTEYASMKWALYFLAEYIHMITGCAFFTILFLGGWDAIPFVGEFPLVAEGFWGALLLIALKTGVFVVKVAFLLFVMMWVRWTLPRFRFDQLMSLAWRGLIPLCLTILLLQGLFIALQLPRWSFILTDGIALAAGAIVAPLLPKGQPTNRRVLLDGSRFSAPPTA